MEKPLFQTDNVAKVYFKLAIPLVFSMVVTMVYNLADTYFVAATNDTDLVAGVSLCAPIFTFLMALGNIFGQGGNSLISRLLGKGEQEDARRVSAFCFYMTLGIGIVVAVIMVVFRNPLLVLLGANDATLPHASDYYLCLAIGAPIVMESFIHTNLLRMEGMSKESMIATVSGAVLNIILDPIFISVMNMGAAGAAIASVLGYLFSVVYCLIIVMRRSHALSLKIQGCWVSKDYQGQIYSIGLSAALTGIMSSISTILTNQLLLPYGNEKIAALGIAVKISMIVSLVLTGLAYGGQPMIGYYYGANDKARLSKLIKFCLRFLCAVSLILSAIVFIAAPQLMRMFMDNAQIVTDGALMLRLQVVSMIFVSIVLLTTILFQSIGQAAISLILSISRQGVVFIVVVLIASELFGCTGVIASQAVADLLSAALAIGLLMKNTKKLFG